MELQPVDTRMPVVLGLHSGEFICTGHIQSDHMSWALNRLSGLGGVGAAGLPALVGSIVNALLLAIRHSYTVPVFPCRLCSIACADAFVSQP